MWSHRLLVPSIIVFLSATAALACGPFFPWQLLDDRAATLKETPANSFAFEAAHLASAPRDGLIALEGDPSTDLEEAREAEGHQLEALRGMRLSNSGDEASAKGAILPAAIRLYTAGAVDFKSGKLARARGRFKAVLLLPDNEKRVRETWAAYMLGRSYAAEGDTEKASQAFKLTRELAIHGAPDPLGLAVSSYGEEARAYLVQAKSYLNGNEIQAQAAQAYSRDTAAAVALYAQQAAHGSTSGIWSLRDVARELLSADTKIRACVSDPLVQRLLVVYVLAHFNDAPAWSPARIFVREPYYRNAAPPILPGARLRPGVFVVPGRSFFRLLDAIQIMGVDHRAGADRLAALTYRLGRYDLAQKLAEKAAGPLAAWIKAKLALQKGDVTAAAAFYAEASKAFPPAGDRSPSIDESNETLLLGENGVLTLARGEYANALAQLYPMAVTYWGDVAYIAERVLTVDELRRFVDAGSRPGLVGLPEHYYLNARSDPSATMRNLLARRLVREDRFKEAMPYFSDSQVAKRVEEYARSLHDAAHRWRGLARARAWYQAAVLARNSGREMMGYAGPPDYLYNVEPKPDELGHEFVTQGERVRFEASAAEPDLQYHYRYVAVQEASRAADLLPPRSQAFAAALCQATGWMIHTPVDGKSGSRELVHQLYRRYLKQGPYVPWAAHFGRACPDPDFDGAARFNRTLLLKKARHLGSHYRWLIAATLVLGVVGLAVARRMTGRWAFRKPE